MSKLPYTFSRLKPVSSVLRLFIDAAFFFGVVLVATAADGSPGSEATASAGCVSLTHPGHSHPRRSAYLNPANWG